MKIIKLIAENVKGLKAVEIVPDEYFQIISGKNGQGKSSVLDSIWYALGGGKALEDTEKPIRHGEDQASVTLDLGDITVTRRWKGETTALDVRTKDGAKYSSPQTLLDTMIGRLSFDPLAFCNLDEKKQVHTLQELIGFNPDALNLQRQKLYDQRTLVNRDIKQLEGQLSGIAKPAPDTPDEEVSAAAILQELKVAQEVQKSNDQIRKEYAELDHSCHQIEIEISDLDKQIARLQAVREAKFNQLISSKDTLREKKVEVEQLQDPDLGSFQTRLEQVEQLNQIVRSKKQFMAISEKMLEAKIASDRLTDQIEEIDKQKEEALRQAKFPIEGLSFGETGITFNGIPFKQCSAAERLKVSLAMAMALNPKVRIIRILDGSLLDEDNLAVIQEMAKEKDYQVWVEVVDSSGKVGVFIEDGQVKTPA